MTAPVWKRILKWIAGLFSSALALAIVAYLTLVAINWRDEPPSEAAERLTAAYRDRPPIPDADNAYVYTMGLVVGPDGDPREAGIRRIEWMRTLSGNLSAPASNDPVPAYDGYLSSRSPAIKKISEACWRPTPECAGELDRGEDTLRAWVASEQWLLDRYLTVLRHPGWLESVPFDARAPLVVSSPLFEGQKLLLVRAYLLASENDAAGVRELLGNDARFWRRVLASSDVLITKMIATAALTRTFETGNLVLRRLPAQSQLNAIPTEWTEAFSRTERSMLRCLTGEWLFSQQMLKQAIASEPPFGDFADAHEQTFVNRMLSEALGLLFLPQDLSNRQADTIIRAAGALDVPFEQLSAGLERAHAIFKDPTADRSTLAMLYNPFGSFLLELTTPAYASYPVRVTDLEGTRRAAVLTTLLRAQKINEQNMAAELEASELRGPYNAAPFIWNAKERAVEFIGRVEGERGRHTFPY
ncbi:MAG TPA: hypothetical protein VGD45_09095 [Steroidobacter sp.]|uniref:hypothetical protein n=1 Tax=Steroidobacter sp. TaxID=1978227 RepID=UPI002ED87A53